MITQFKKFRSKNRNLYKIVYRGCRIPDSKLYNGMFFSEDSEYAKVFGNFVEKYKIKIGKVLNLNKYNDICKKQIPDYYYYIGLPFIMHKNNIMNKWDIVMDSLYINNLEDVAKEFQKELEECNTIYGKDAGDNETKVWFVKNKDDVEKL